MPDIKDDDGQGELFALDHKPIQPPRQNHDGEQVYSSIWEATMRPKVEITFHDEHVPIEDVLCQFPGKITQRHASILASVACWLGTAIGSGMLDMAKRISTAQVLYPENAYLVAWALQNTRYLSVNHGVRTVEFLLAPKEMQEPRGGYNHSGLKHLPDLSADDLEVIDHMMLWLGRSDGQRYLTRCEAKLQGIEHERRLLRDADGIRLGAAAATA